MKCKKIAAYFLAFVLCLSLLSGCGKQSEAGSGSSPVSSESSSVAADEYANYPERDIELVLPVGASGDTAVNVQVLIPLVEEALGNDATFVVNAMPGAASSVGLLYARDQKADGYSAAFTNTNHALIRAMGYADLTYEDFDVICSAYTECVDVFIRGDETRFNDIASLVEYGLAHPDELNIGTAAVGGCFYFGAFDFLKKTGIEATLIGNDEGSAGLAISLLNGDVDVVITSMGTLNTYVKSGEISMIASASEQRLTNYPDGPTITECGYEVVLMSTRGIFVPKGTPQAIKDKLEAAFEIAVNSDTYKQFCLDNSAEAYFLNGEEYEEYLAEELELFTELVNDSGLVKK